MISMKEILGILFIFAIYIFARYFTTKKMEKFMVFLFALSLCFQINLFSVGASLVHLNRYNTDYWNFWLVDFCALFLGFRAIIKPGSPKKFKKYWLPLFYILFNGISIFAATNKMASITTFARAVELFILFLFFAERFDVSIHFKPFMSGLIVSVWFESLLAFYQKFSGGVLGLSFLGETIAAFRVHEIAGEASSGIAGTFEHSADFAIFCLFTLCFLLVNKNTFKNSVLYFVTVLIDILALFLSDSRTALVLCAIVFCIYIIKNLKVSSGEFAIARGPGLWAFMILFFIPLLALFNDNLVSKLNIESLLYSANIRLTQWGEALIYILQSPLLGHGANNYVDFMYTYKFSAYNTIWNFQNPVHNTYLLFWFDLGIGGLITVVLMQVKYSILGVKKYKSNPIFLSSGAFILISLLYWFTGWAFMKKTIIFMLWTVYGLVNNTSMEMSKNQ